MVLSATLQLCDFVDLLFVAFSKEKFYILCSNLFEGFGVFWKDFG